MDKSSQQFQTLDLTAMALLVALCASWGLQQVSIKVAIQGVSPVLQAGFRSLGATALVGIWMWVRFEQNELAPRNVRVIDVLERQSVWPGRRHAAEKRQLSGAELRARGLCNEADA